MAYDRYDTRGGSRDEGPRWSERRFLMARPWRLARDRGDRGGRDERGFFERAGDEIASWFGDDDSERRRHPEDRHSEGRGWDSDRSRDRLSRDRGQDRDRNWNDNRGAFASGGSSESDYNRGWQRELAAAAVTGGGRDRFRDRGRDYRPMTGDYGRAARSSDDEWDRDLYRSTSRAGTSRLVRPLAPRGPALQQLARPPHERTRSRL